MANLSCIPKFVKKEIIDIWVAENWKLMLLNNHVPNPATQQFVSNVAINEIPASGPYTAGGVSITGKVSVEHNPSLGTYNYYLDADDKVIGPNATLNYKFGILFQDTGDPTTSKIRAQIEFTGGNSGYEIVTNGTSTIKWNTLGIIYIS